MDADDFLTSGDEGAHADVAYRLFFNVLIQRDVRDLEADWDQGLAAVELLGRRRAALRLRVEAPRVCSPNSADGAFEELPPCREEVSVLLDDLILRDVHDRDGFS